MRRACLATRLGPYLASELHSDREGAKLSGGIGVLMMGGRRGGRGRLLPSSYTQGGDEEPVERPRGGGSELVTKVVVATRR
jgi:hypothetical protein